MSLCSAYTVPSAYNTYTNTQSTIYVSGLQLWLHSAAGGGADVVYSFQCSPRSARNVRTHYTLVGLGQADDVVSASKTQHRTDTPPRPTRPTRRRKYRANSCKRTTPPCASNFMHYSEHRTAIRNHSLLLFTLARWHINKFTGQCILSVQPYILLYVFRCAVRHLLYIPDSSRVPFNVYIYPRNRIALHKRHTQRVPRRQRRQRRPAHKAPHKTQYQISIIATIFLH